jgi:rSAM/selenodomain-associated transferase 1
MHRLLDSALSNQVPPDRCALGIMTKAPRIGEVKTRLQPPLTPEEAAALNICFLRDTAAAISQACSRSGGLRPATMAQGVAIFTPAGSESDYAEILPAEFDFLPQRGNHFGERLTHAVEDLLRVGFQSCCLVDSDSPTVTAEVFRAAVEFLRADLNRLILGPSDDGGYYLIGMGKLHRRVFEGIDWSTEHVLPQTLARARELGLDVEMLPTIFDVDDRVSLCRLCDELLGKKRDSAPATKAFLEQLIAREGRERIWPL